MCTYHIDTCVPWIRPYCQNRLCSKVAEFNLFNLMTGHDNTKKGWTLYLLFLITNFVWQNWGNHSCTCIQRQRKTLTWACWLFFRRMTLTHFPALPRFGSSLWIPDPVGISLVSTARAPLSAVPPDVKIQSFCVPGVNRSLKQMENLLLLKPTCKYKSKKGKKKLQSWSLFKRMVITIWWRVWLSYELSTGLHSTCTRVYTPRGTIFRLEGQKIWVTFHEVHS